MFAEKLQRRSARLFKIFGDWLCETAAKDQQTDGDHAAMREGSGMVEFS